MRPTTDKFKLTVKVHLERLSEKESSAKISKPQPVCIGRIGTSAKMQTCTKKKKNNKVHFLDSSISLDSISYKKDLRKRKTKNYAELSVCSPANKSVSNRSETHIPIYLKQEAATKPNKRLKEDPFEFVPETPRAYRRRLHNQGVQESNTSGDSVLYDKETHEILKKLEAKEEAKLRAKQLADKKQTRNKLKTNIDSNQRKISVDTQSNIKSKPISNTTENRLITFNNHVRNINVSRSPKDDINSYFGFDDGSETETSSISASPTSHTITKSIPTRKKRKVTENLTALSSTPVTKRQSMRNTNTKTKCQVLSNKNSRNVTSRPDTSIIRQSHKRLLNQGVSAATSTPQNKSLQLNKDNVSFIQKNQTPFSALLAATTTPQNQNRSTFRESSNENSPWRSTSTNISRNPHFLTMKNTSLPSYNQEMILDPKLIERRQAVPNSSFQNKDTSLLQTSLLDFVDESLSKTPSKSIMEQSLFDNAVFSPLKSNKKVKTPNKSPAKAKRNVFGILKPSNKENISSSEKVYGVDNYFGFESFTEENEENKENRKNTVRKIKFQQVIIAAQPTRILPKEAKTLQDNIVADILQNIESTEHSEHDFPEEQKDDAPQVALFEDLQVFKQPRRSYERKRARRVRVRSVDSDESEEVVKPKAKRKDIRTPQEQQEFNKWVAQFNAMCEEVENHTLETD